MYKEGRGAFLRGNVWFFFLLLSLFSLCRQIKHTPKKRWWAAMVWALDVIYLLELAASSNSMREISSSGETPEKKTLNEIQFLPFFYLLKKNQGGTNWGVMTYRNLTFSDPPPVIPCLILQRKWKPYLFQKRKKKETFSFTSVTMICSSPFQMLAFIFTFHFWAFNGLWLVGWLAGWLAACINRNNKWALGVPGFIKRYFLFI